MEKSRRVIGAGHPRGGTRYVSQLLVTAGLRALHEANGKGGSVSAWLAFPDWWNPHQNASGLRSDYADAEILHIVRHPLTAIASLSVFPHGSFWHWQEKHTGVEYRKDAIDFYAEFWLRWNQGIDGQRPFARILIEHPEKTWPRLAERFDLPLAMPEIAIDPTWITKRRPEVTWSDLGEWEEPVREQALAYGY